MKCQKCSSENRPHARFCRQCGQPLPSEIKPSIEARDGGQVTVGDGMNIQIGSVHGGQVNISPSGQAPQAHPPPSSVSGLPTPLPDERPQLSGPFKLQLIQRDGLEFEVRALDTPMGEPQALSRLPYTHEELVAVQKALRAAERFTPVQLDILKKLGLLINSHVVPDLHKRVGESLYNSLMPEDIDTAFQMALNQARPIKGTVALQLRFDENAVELAQYPWELLYRRRALLPSRAVELTRYISYPEAITTLSVTPPLRLLYIQPRPTDLPTLPDESEQTIVRHALGALEAENILRVEALPQSTYEALLDYLETETTHILHFDGHGIFARRCPVCQAMNYPHSTHCHAQKEDVVCGQEIASIEPQGYLAFEHETRQTHWVGSETLGQLLFNRAIHLAVLSACRSSSVGGETLFGGTAPVLIQAGVPAVASTQLPISVDGAIKFARGFYRSLARLESLPGAVNAGRLRMPEQEWFIPTLYLRSKDDEGCLFTRPQGG